MQLSIAELNNQYVSIYGLLDGTTKYLGDGVTPNPSPTYINNATGSVKVIDGTGTAKVIGPASATTSSFSYVAASNGNYRALITSDFNPAAGRTYTLVIDMTSPGGLVAHWEIPLVVKPRQQ